MTNKAERGSQDFHEYTEKEKASIIDAARIAAKDLVEEIRLGNLEKPTDVDVDFLKLVHLGLVEEISSGVKNESDSKVAWDRDNLEEELRRIIGN